MKKTILFFFTILVMLGLSPACSEKNAADPDPNPSDTTSAPLVPIRELRSDLNFPWEILWGKDDHIWMTERSGRISKIKPDDGVTVFFQTISDVSQRGEGGLLGMAQDPGFLTNGYLYVVYNYLKGSVYTEKVVRLKFANNQLVEPLILLDDIPASNIHNGSRIWVTANPDAKLYISTGDAASSSSAQDAASLSGKILRINTDGSIPADNPITGSPLWSLGHRNPQGMVMVDGKLFTAEHGPSIEDEVNIIQKGRNYGWPQVNGQCNSAELTFCNSANVLEPIWSTGGSTFALSGMDYYGDDLIPEWTNALLVASLKNATLYVLKMNNDRTQVVSSSQYFSGTYGRLRDLCVSPAGSVYMCTSNGGSKDKLIEINKP